MHLTNLKAHARGRREGAGPVRAGTVGHFVLDVDIKEIRALLRPGEPELQFGGDKIGIKLPVRVARRAGATANVRFQWEGKGIAGAVCGDLDVSPDVSSDVAPATYTVEGEFLLVRGRRHGVGQTPLRRGRAQESCSSPGEDLGDPGRGGRGREGRQERDLRHGHPEARHQGRSCRRSSTRASR